MAIHLNINCGTPTFKHIAIPINFQLNACILDNQTIAVASYINHEFTIFDYDRVLIAKDVKNSIFTAEVVVATICGNVHWYQL